MGDYKMEGKASTYEKGLSYEQKFSAKEPLRGETSVATQRPVHKTTTMKTDRGTFKVPG